MGQLPQPMRRTKQEIDALIEEYQQNEDSLAQNVLVEHYTALVGSLARKYSKGRDFHEDIMQVGMLGLLAALKRYDQGAGRSFETFLIPTVIGEIKRFYAIKRGVSMFREELKKYGQKLNRRGRVDQSIPALS